MHFVVNIYNGLTTWFCGGYKVKYADVLSGAEGFTMVICIGGGIDARIEPPFMIS